VTEALHLTDLSEDVRDRGLGRYTKSGTWRRILYRTFIATREILTSAPRDVLRGLRKQPKTWIRLEPGARPDANATRIALYVHYSATGQISEMVRHQLEVLGQSGFSIVFITMANHIPEEDWQAVRHLTALMVQRQNFGLDFGAWRDLMPEVRRRWSGPNELLLANDSVLGPIHPMAPTIEALRTGGHGLFGLTESLQGGPHLQSYLLLARGSSAVDDLMHFVQTLHISHSKWILVQRSEVRLSPWMRRRGHRVAALFGYDRLVKATIADTAERESLRLVYKRLQNLDQLSTDAAIKALHRWPLNPTHHLWRVLAGRFDYPFLKTELIRRNPAHLPGVAEWELLVPPDSPCPLPVIQAHLATLTATSL
jgi:lipopolysaccharide biosynthesis protein